MSKTVVGSFDTFDHARAVVAALEAMGVAPDDVSMVAHDAARRFAAGREDDTAVAPQVDAPGLPEADRGTLEVGDDATIAAGRGAAAGGLLGGTAGLIAGLAGLAIPGVGPLLAAGPIAAALTGAGLGALTGGLLGGLRQVGVSDADAEYYAEAVRRGGALVVVRAEDDRATAIADAMRSHGAVDLGERVAAWRASGWRGFEAESEPWTDERIARERFAYRTGAGLPQAVDRSDEHRDLRSGGHPNLGFGSERPGVDPTRREHGRSDRPGAASGLPGSAAGAPPGGSTGDIGDTTRREAAGPGPGGSGGRGTSGEGGRCASAEGDRGASALGPGAAVGRGTSDRGDRGGR